MDQSAQPRRDVDGFLRSESVEPAPHLGVAAAGVSLSELLRQAMARDADLDGAGGIASGGRADLRPRTGWTRPSRHPRERGVAAGVAHQAEDAGSRRAPGTRAPSSASLPRAVVPDGRGVVRASWLTDLDALWGPLESDDSAGDVAVRGGQAAACVLPVATAPLDEGPD